MSKSLPMILIYFYVTLFLVIVSVALAGQFPPCSQKHDHIICVEKNSWIERHKL